ncbi:uncharacterized protein LOC127576889 [Pristis pectinata]|uniref:uncharacterized protein LOC127576889 n=1 Tax=Pristis pectinata TaxID=685728 RepID=UPI00223C95AC|nr:uncharacterized protein LOC127576889 [Pristis pectinata]XP_051883669.1 uncharacterized protein LOC127576889 [Pristis pectinata]XP_051883670.1 uncharacterized protein LOC127576889 [Pristis pectinata]
MYPAAGPYGHPAPWWVTVPTEALVLPPIQMHNFSSRPLTVVMVDANFEREGAGKYTEYHHFYRTPYMSPFWFPSPASSAPYPYPPYYPYGGYFPQQPSLVTGGWPEGSTLRGDLHWGKIEQIYGPRRELPDFLQDELRRVYGTYPKTFVTITYQNGEYLVKAEPKVGEQKYKVEKKVIRRPPTPSDDESEVVEKQKRKSRR